MGNNRPYRPNREPGGQHIAPVGTPTWDHYCPFGFSLELQRAAEQFDQDSAGGREPDLLAGIEDVEAARGESVRGACHLTNQ